MDIIRRVSYSRKELLNFINVTGILHFVHITHHFPRLFLKNFHKSMSKFKSWHFQRFLCFDWLISRPSGTGSYYSDWYENNNRTTQTNY